MDLLPVANNRSRRGGGGVESFHCPRGPRRPRDADGDLFIYIEFVLRSGKELGDEEDDDDDDEELPQRTEKKETIAESETCNLRAQRRHFNRFAEQHLPPSVASEGGPRSRRNAVEGSVPETEAEQSRATATFRVHKCGINHRPYCIISTAYLPSLCGESVEGGALLQEPKLTGQQQQSRVIRGIVWNYDKFEPHLRGRKGVSECSRRWMRWRE